MTDAPLLDRLTPAHLAALLAAQSFAELAAAAGAAADALLGAQAAAEQALLLDAEPPSGVWIINAATLHKHRPFHPYPLEESSLEILRQGEAIRVLAHAPAGLLKASARAGAPLSATPAATLVVPIKGAHRTLGAWVLGLAAPLTELDPGVSEALVQAAAALGRVLPGIQAHEQTDCVNQQIQLLHEAMLKALIAPDKATLFSTLLGILNRQFGFSRVIVAQVHGEAKALRSELHSGFDASFIPFTLPLDERQNPVIRILNEGEVQILEAGPGPGLTGAPPALAQSSAERRVLLPLRIGVRPIGLIYAEQPLDDGTPLFKSVLEILARLAAVAIENLSLRLRAEQRADTDPLTGLYNRYFLDKVLELEIPRIKRYNHPISLLMLDLCDFKRVNDTYGHQFGDYLLRETAGLIQSNVRRPDVVVRYGGDEFVVLMVNTSADQASLVRDRIERAFIERNRLQTDESMMIKVSMGLRSADAAGIEGLLHEADMAMYAHKARQARVKLIEALIEGSPEKIEQADRVVGSLCNILYKKAPYYPGHARRVTHIALRLGRRLGLDAGQLENLALAALLHDVGKVSLPTEILQKIGPLSAGEIEAMRHHPLLGEEFFQGLEHLEPIRPIIHSHHERYDGLTSGKFPGYPSGLCGEAIPLAARILKLAESADVMLTGRPYRPALPPAEVTRILHAEAGKSFDPHLVNILLADKDWQDGMEDMARIIELLGCQPC